MEQQQKDGWKSFIHLCSGIKDDKTLSALFELMFTAEEKQDLAMRYMIIKELLKKQKTQREIAKDLAVSIAKITRGSNELKRMNESLIQFLKTRLCGDKA
jgi:TrpR family trp operon transcriptional repressor